MYVMLRKTLGVSSYIRMCALQGARFGAKSNPATTKLTSSRSIGSGSNAHTYKTLSIRDSLFSMPRDSEAYREIKMKALMPN